MRYVDRMRVIAVAVLALFAVACTSNSSDVVEPAVQTSPLDDAVANWSAADIDSYLIRAVDVDQTPMDGGCAWITEVHGSETGVRWTAQSDVECGDWDVSVPALHEQVAAFGVEIEQAGGRIDVGWSELGVPTHIDFAPVTGDGRSVTIEFGRLDGEPSIRSELAAARMDWSEADIGSYRLELSELRNYWSKVCRWTTVVADGVVVEALAESESSSLCSETGWTVEMLFDLVASWADRIDDFSDPAFGEHTLVAEFAEYGVPVTLVFDLANGADEESSLQISFTPQLD